MCDEKNNPEIVNFSAMAIGLADENAVSGQGGPFGAVIVKNKQIVAKASNRVLTDIDPTAHAEIVAIREACKTLGTYFLEDCAIYCSCEPCPMCLGAIYWAHIPDVYYCADREDAAAAGFDDSMIYQELALNPDDRKLKLIHIKHPDARKPFEKWVRFEAKKKY